MIVFRFAAVIGMALLLPASLVGAGSGSAASPVQVRDEPTFVAYYRVGVEAASPPTVLTRIGQFNVVRSPDGRTLLYEPHQPYKPNQTLYALATRPFAGGPERLLAPGIFVDPYPYVERGPVAPTPGRFSPDGSAITFTGAAVTCESHPCPPSVYIVNTDGSNLHVLATYGEYAYWSPDRRRLVYLDQNTCGEGAGEGPYGDGTVTVVSSDGRIRKPISPSGKYACEGYAVWSPHADLIVYHGNSTDHCHGLCVVNPDGSKPHRIGFPGAALPIWSPNGSLIAFNHKTGCCMAVVYPDGRGLRQLTRAQYDRPIAWSPDSTRIAYIHATTHDRATLEVITLSTRHSIRLATAISFTDIRWSTDGRTLTYAAETNQQP